MKNEFAAHSKILCKKSVDFVHQGEDQNSFLSNTPHFAASHSAGRDIIFEQSLWICTKSITICSAFMVCIIRDSYTLLYIFVGYGTSEIHSKIYSFFIIQWIDCHIYNKVLMATKQTQY